MKYIFNEPKIEYTVRELINSFIPKTKFEICDTIPDKEDYTCVNITSYDSVFLYDIKKFLRPGSDFALFLLIPFPSF